MEHQTNQPKVLKVQMTRLKLIYFGYKKSTESWESWKKRIKRMTTNKKNGLNYNTADAKDQVGDRSC